MGTTGNYLPMGTDGIELLHGNTVLHAGRLESRYRPPVPHRSYEGDWERKVIPLLGAIVIGCAVWLVTVAFG